jgi:hypothetical protein
MACLHFSLTWCILLAMDVATQLPHGDAVKPPRKKYRHRSGRKNGRKPPAVLQSKLVMLTRENLDRRSLAYRRFDAIVAQIGSDISGVSVTSAKDGVSNATSSVNLSAVQIAMIEAFASASVQIDVLTTKALLGEDVDARAFAALSSTLVRVGSRLGITRKGKPANATGSLSDYLSGKAAVPDAAPAPGDDVVAAPAPDEEYARERAERRASP